MARKNPIKPGSKEAWGDKGSKATSPNTDNKHKENMTPAVESPKRTDSKQEPPK